YLEKGEVARQLAGSHMVLCLLDDFPGCERIYPGKIFELMYLGRPCLTLAPPGALADLVAAHRLGPVVPPRDEAAIAAALAGALRAFRDGRYRATADATGIERYHRRALAGRFAEVFRGALARARGGVRRAGRSHARPPASAARLARAGGGQPLAEEGDSPGVGPRLRWSAPRLLVAEEDARVSFDPRTALVVV